MKTNEFDRLLDGWLEGEAPRFSPPPGLHADAMNTARRARQRPPWLADVLGGTRARSTRQIVMPSLSRRYVLLVLAVLVLLAIGSLLAGGPKPPTVPFGAGRNGLVAFDQDWHIFVQNLDGTDRRQLTTSTYDFRPHWSPDGNLLAAYRSTDSLGEGHGISIWVMRPDGSEATNTTVGLEIKHQQEWEFAWAPTSDRIAFASGDAIASGIWLATLRGATPRQIVADDLVASSPAWSPDGTTIAFEGRTDDGGRAIYLVNEDGSDLRRLTVIEHTFTGYGVPAWSPDGARLLFFAGYPGMHDIWAIERDGSGERPLADEPGQVDELSPAWSPDGTRIAYQLIDHDQGTSSVVVMNADGTTPRRLSPDADGAVVWSPDGARLLSSLCLSEVCDANAPTAFVAFDPSGAQEAQRVGALPGLGMFSWQRLPP